jgi:hypothetical protein
MCQFGAHDVSFRPTNLGASKIGSPWLGCLTVSRGQEFEIGPVALRQRLDRGQSCTYYLQESREKAPLSLDKFAFARLQDAPEGGDQSQLLAASGLSWAAVQQLNLPPGAPAGGGWACRTSPTWARLGS